MQPIPLLLAVAINRESPVTESICNHERHKFFGELIRAVVVRGTSDPRGKLVSADVRPNQEIRGRLRRGVRTARLQWKIFIGEDTWGNVTIHFISGNMNKSGHRHFTCYFEQNESARNVGLNYRSWLVDTPVDMGLCGEMYNGITTTHCCFYGG